MMNVQSKEYYLIEINPRFSANISLAVNVGIDFPLYYTRLALDQIVDVKFNTSANSYAQWLIPGDLLNFIFNKDRFRQKVGYFFNKPDDLTHAIFSKDDIKPFFANILSLFINFFSNIRDLLVKLKANKE